MIAKDGMTTCNASSPGILLHITHFLCEHGVESIFNCTDLRLLILDDVSVGGPTFVFGDILISGSRGFDL